MPPTHIFLASVPRTFFCPGDEGVVDLLLNLPSWRHQQLLAFWSNSIEAEYLRGLAKLTAAHASHETIFAQEATPFFVVRQNLLERFVGVSMECSLE